MIKAPELLMPAGNFEKLKYAFAYGADAVYAGVPKYSLRARENQFNKEEDIVEAIEYTHSLNKKIYLTTNILPHNRKVQPFMDSLKRIIPHKPDAFITSDPGLIMLMREKYPQIEIHLSVQANCVNWASARFWYEQGVKRLILSRELSISEIAEIHEKVPELELEAFVHGSICIAYSGRCLLSNYFNHRDANQGTCTNSCRWSYNVHKRNMEATPRPDDEPVIDGEYTSIEGEYYLEQADRPGELMLIDEDENGSYIMNAKDLMALEYIEDLCKAGVSSLKVEGRSKTLYYVAQVARIYREAIDDLASGKQFNKALIEDIQEVANRGYTTGFLKGNPKEYGQNYLESRPKYTKVVYAGQIIKNERDKNEILVDVKNKFSVGDVLEIISPGGKKQKLEVKFIKNDRGDNLDSVSGGVNQVSLNCDLNIADFSIITAPLQTHKVNGKT